MLDTDSLSQCKDYPEDLNTSYMGVYEVVRKRGSTIHPSQVLL